MSAVKYCRKLKKIAAVLIFFIVCAVSPVSADQQFVLAVGDTMVIPCLLEIWSDQSVDCVISNPDVLMTDGSGRAVIAISEGISDVYVHMTNPDTDIRYTFIVVSAQRPEAPAEWAQPEAAGGGVRPENGSGTGGAGASPEAEGVVPGNDAGIGGADTGTAVGGVTTENNAGAGEADAVAANGEVRPENGSGTGDGTDAGAATGRDIPETDAGTGDGTDADALDGLADTHEDPHMPDESIADTQEDPRASESGETDAGGTERAVPFWEERGDGGISFEVIGDDSPGNTDIKRDTADGASAKYRPFAYLKGDGEIVPLFVCVAGHEVRWKYIESVLYIEATQTCKGPLRVGACDSRGNIYYFSS